MSIKELARHSRTAVVDGQAHVISTVIVVQRQRDEIGFVIRQPGQDGPVKVTEVILSLNADELEMLRGCLETGLKARVEAAEAELARVRTLRNELAAEYAAAEARVRELEAAWDEQGIYDAGKSTGATSERAAIVAWLRQQEVAEAYANGFRNGNHGWSDDIERGAHIQKEGGEE